MPRVELFVDLQPDRDRDPRQHREPEHQRLLVDAQEENPLQVQDRARLIRRLKTQRHQDDVG